MEPIIYGIIIVTIATIIIWATVLIIKRTCRPSGEILVRHFTNLDKAGDVSGKRCIVLNRLKGYDPVFAGDKLPEKLKRGDVCYTVPAAPVNLHKRIRVNESWHTIDLQIEFIEYEQSIINAQARLNFATFIKSRKTLSFGELHELVFAELTESALLQDEITLCKALNVSLIKYGLSCLTVKFDIQENTALKEKRVAERAAAEKAEQEQLEINRKARESAIRTEQEKTRKIQEAKQEQQQRIEDEARRIPKELMPKLLLLLSESEKYHSTDDALKRTFEQWRQRISVLGNIDLTEDKNIGKIIRILDGLPNSEANALLPFFRPDSWSKFKSEFPTHRITQTLNQISDQWHKSQS